MDTSLRTTPIPAVQKYGHFVVKDSGTPSDQHEYTTLIMFNGMGWHSAIFDKFFPLAAGMNVRLVTVNRPDYPGSTPLSDYERKKLEDITAAANNDPEVASSALIDYVSEQSRKVFDFLVEFVLTQRIPAKGGIIVAGWSLGAVTVLGLLANISTFTSKEVNLRAYIKHFVLYDAPSHMLGYKAPPCVYNSLFDTSLTPGETAKAFNRWVSGYYAHGEDFSKLSSEPLDSPMPTIFAMDPADIQRCLDVAPAMPGSADERIISLGVQLEVFERLKKSALYVSADKEGSVESDSQWGTVGVKHVWCDASPWEVPWGVICLQSEIQESQKLGNAIREVDLVRVRGGNHFCHWDKPELAFTGLLSEL